MAILIIGILFAVLLFQADPGNRGYAPEVEECNYGRGAEPC